MKARDQLGHTTKHGKKKSNDMDVKADGAKEAAYLEKEATSQRVPQSPCMYCGGQHNLAAALISLSTNSDTFCAKSLQPKITATMIGSTADTFNKRNRRANQLV